MRSHWTTLIGFLAAAFTTCSYLPQVVKTLRSRQTRDISLMMYGILSAGLFLWFVYGMLLKDLSIILANGITFVLAVIVLVVKIRQG